MSLLIERVRVGVLPVETWSPSTADDETFHYVDIGSVDRDSKSIVGVSELPVRDAPSRARQILRTNDVLVSTVRPNLNTVAIVPEALDGAIGSTGFTVLRANPKRLLPRFLFHWVRSSAFIADMTKKAAGASYPAVSDRIVLESHMPMPRVDEQHRIADILDKTDTIRRKRNEAVALTEELLRSAFLEIFGDPAINPKGWRRDALGNLLSLKSGNFLPAKLMDTSGPFAVYGGNGINGRHSRYMFKEPVITIGRVGVYCGAVHRTEPKSWVTDNALYVAAFSEKLDITYLEHALRIANLNQYASQAAQPLISGGRLYPIEIVVPSKEAQAHFTRFVEMHAVTRDSMQRAHDESERLFVSLVDRVFSQELLALEGTC